MKLLLSVVGKMSSVLLATVTRCLSRTIGAVPIIVRARKTRTPQLTRPHVTSARTKTLLTCSRNCMLSLAHAGHAAHQSHTHTDAINGVSSSLRNLELIYSNPLVSPSVRTSLNNRSTEDPYASVRKSKQNSEAITYESQYLVMDC